MSDHKSDPNDAEAPIADLPSDNNQSYTVGYAKPPTTSQFQPGRSGNPSGRPRGAKSLHSHINSQLNDTVMVKGPQGPRKMPVREVMAKRFLEKALSGDLKTMLALLTMDAVQSDAESSLNSETLTASEKQILAEVLDRSTST